jgi:hypothetical protein
VNTVTSISIPTTRNFHHAHRDMIITAHEIIHVSNQLGVVAISKQHTTNIILGFRMLAFSVWSGRVHHKTFRKLLPSPFPNFENI